MNIVTAFLSAISALANAVEAYFVLKKTSFYYDVTEKYMATQQARL